jgi:enoyl-CoA hydratase/carnithine racemase
MSGRFVDAVEAERIGLVTRVVAPEDLEGAVEALARELAAGPPRALAFTKRAIRRSLDRGMEAEFDYEIFAQVQCLQSDDHRAALAALRERRTPAFEGK